MYSQEDLQGLAGLMSVFRVIMQDMGAAPSDVIEMEEVPSFRYYENIVPVLRELLNASAEMIKEV